MIQKIQVNDRNNRNKNINKATIIVSNNKKRKRERGSSNLQKIS